jgi:hypothetical protein
MTLIWFALHKPDGFTIQISSHSHLDYRLNEEIYLDLMG